MKRHLSGIALVAAILIGGSAQGAQIQNREGQRLQSAGSAQLSPAQRRAIVGRIVGIWGPFVLSVYATDPAVWSRRMASTFAAASDANLLRAVGMKTFQGMVSILVGSRVSDAEVIDSLATRAQVLNSGPLPAVLGDVTDDLAYTPIAPCRIVDTRVSGGPIAGRTTRSFKGYTSTNFSSQGGISDSDCGIPPNPSALVFNVTAASPTQAGYLTIYPFDTTQPLASSLNYGIGADVGNEIVAGMTLGSATDQFSVFAYGTTNVVVDAVGYFMAPQATPLNTTTEIATAIIQDRTDGSILLPACPAIYAMTGSSCYVAGDSERGTFLLGTGPDECTFRNLSGGELQFFAVTQCAQVPGR